MPSEGLPSGLSAQRSHMSGCESISHSIDEHAPHFPRVDGRAVQLSIPGSVESGCSPHSSRRTGPLCVVMLHVMQISASLRTTRWLIGPPWRCDRRVGCPMSKPASRALCPGVAGVRTHGQTSTSRSCCCCSPLMPQLMPQLMCVRPPPQSEAVPASA